jgi:hypothetical protein
MDDDKPSSAVEVERNGYDPKIQSQPKSFKSREKATERDLI